LEFNGHPTPYPDADSDRPPPAFVAGAIVPPLRALVMGPAGQEK